MAALLTPAEAVFTQNILFTKTDIADDNESWLIRRSDLQNHQKLLGLQFTMEDNLLHTDDFAVKSEHFLNEPFL